VGRYQSIISAIISAICIFVVPYLNRKGIIIDETAVTSIVASAVAFIAFVWSCWKNHNITDNALYAQQVLNELRSGVDAEEELFEGEEDDDRESDIQ